MTTPPQPDPEIHPGTSIPVPVDPGGDPGSDPGKPVTDPDNDPRVVGPE
ncbi:MAG: hypothetical protein ACJ72E_10520 [Marmoricola sp.]